MSKKHNVKKRGKEAKEFEEEVLQIARVTRVVKGGRRLRFRATVIVGNKKGKVGVGLGKASEVSVAIQKAIARAKKSLMIVPIEKERETIPHTIRFKFKASEILIMPASSGTGLIAGGAVRKILELAGVKNVLSKTFGTNNKVVNAQATIKALKLLKPVKQGKTVVKEELKVKDSSKKAEKNEEKKESAPKKDAKK